MAGITPPVRPKEFSLWYNEATATNATTEATPRHALVLIGCARDLYHRWLPVQFRAELCTRQEFPSYSTSLIEDACHTPTPDSPAGAVRFGTQLLVFDNVTVNDLSRDAKRFAEALRHFHIIVLVDNQAHSSQVSSAILARTLKLGADGSPYLVVSPNQLAPNQDTAVPMMTSVEVAATARPRSQQREATAAEKAAQLVQLRLYAAALRTGGKCVS